MQGTLGGANFVNGHWYGASDAVDSSGHVGWNTSLAFSPPGQPGIAYVDKFSGDLKYACEVIVKKEGAVLKSASENVEK